LEKLGLSNDDHQKAGHAVGLSFFTGRFTTKKNTPKLNVNNNSAIFAKNISIYMLRIRKHRQKRDVLGFRLPMLTYEEPELDVSEIIIIDPDNTFFMRMGSDAMTSYHILNDHVLVIDRTLKPVSGSIVVFFYEDGFFTREYAPEAGKLILKADTPADSIVIEQTLEFVCWGVVTLTLNPVLQPQHRMGRYAHVCAC
jgi:DNA polymerase V